MALCWYTSLSQPGIPKATTFSAKFWKHLKSGLLHGVRALHRVASNRGLTPRDSAPVIRVIGFELRVRPPPGFKPVSSIGVLALSDRRLEIV